jgi:hypothetical protein
MKDLGAKLSLLARSGTSSTSLRNAVPEIKLLAHKFVALAPLV